MARTAPIGTEVGLYLKSSPTRLVKTLGTVLEPDGVHSLVAVPQCNLPPNT